jgi:phage protein U
MSERAREGDRVRVFWENGGCIEGVVEYAPQSTGDSWVLIEDDGSIVHVGLFYGMRVLSRRGILSTTRQGLPRRATNEMPMVRRDGNKPS